MCRPRKPIITHEQALQRLHISSAKLHKLCEHGVGPKRKKIKAGKQDRWSYDPESLATYVPMTFCAVCHQPIAAAAQPKCGNARICSAECKKQWSARLQGRKSLQPVKRKVVNSWEVICPACGVKHIHKSDIKPDKWVYCPNHVKRRNWAESPIDGRVIGAGYRGTGMV